MDAPLANDTSRWLPLGDACRLLDVSQATLRQWADGGHLRAYRTPGGHRRFLRDDVETLIKGNPLSPEPAREDALEESVLRRIRRRLHHQSMAGQAWYQGVEAEKRVRLRLFGRRLLSLLVQQGSLRPRRRQVLAESYLLGREYAAEMAGRSLPIKKSVGAFFLPNLGADGCDRLQSGAPAPTGAGGSSAATWVLPIQSSRGFRLRQWT